MITHCIDISIIRRITMISLTIVSGIYMQASNELPPDSTKSKNRLYTCIKRHFDESNKPKENRQFDFSLIGGPHYSSDTKLGLGIVASGFYYSSFHDSVTSLSNMSLYGDICTSGFYLLGIRGNHLFPHDKYRIEYNFYFYSFPTKYWGIGYDNANNNRNYINYDDFRFQFKIDTYFLIGKKTYVGPGITFDKIKAKDVENIVIWGNMPLKTVDFGIGVHIIQDTRDNLTASKNGYMIGIYYKHYPRWLWNKHTFSILDIQFNKYLPVWRKSVLAMRWHSKIGYGDVPWGLLPSFGGSYNMRGYYEGRFRDKLETDITLELRQHVWRRSGLALWLGCGTVFPDLSKFSFSKILPNCGIGYRWEFKKNSNIRLDFGVGRGETNFIFNINEAF